MPVDLNIRNNNIKLNILSVIAFTAVFLFTFSGDFTLYYDANTYHKMATQMLSFDALTLEDYLHNLAKVLEIRGYFFPFYISLFKSILFFIPLQYIIAIMSSTTFFLAILGLCSIFDVKFTLPRFVACYTLILFLFPQLFSQTLSDLYAVSFLIFSFLFAKKAVEVFLTKKTMSLIFVLLSGVFIYASYNIRTIYLFTIPIFIIYLFPYQKTQKRFFTYLLRIVTFFVGILLSGFPQLLINIIVYDYVSLFIKTDLVNPNLMLMQLIWGLDWIRYETFIGDASTYPALQLYFLDNTFNHIPDLTFKIGSVGDYIVFVLNNFTTYVIFFIKHTVSVFSVFFTKVYLTTLDVEILPYFVSLNVLFFSVFDSFRKATKKFNKNILTTISAVSITLAIFFPLLAIIPGAVEGRFAISGYLFFIFYLSFILKPRELYRYLKSKTKLFLILYLSFMAITIVIGLDILSSIEHASHPVSFKIW